MSSWGGHGKVDKTSCHPVISEAQEAPSYQIATHQLALSPNQSSITMLFSTSAFLFSSLAVLALTSANLYPYTGPYLLSYDFRHRSYLYAQPHPSVHPPLHLAAISPADTSNLLSKPCSDGARARNKHPPTREPPNRLTI